MHSFTTSYRNQTIGKQYAKAPFSSRHLSPLAGFTTPYRRIILPPPRSAPARPPRSQPYSALQMKSRATPTGFWKTSAVLPQRVAGVQSAGAITSPACQAACSHSRRRTLTLWTQGRHRRLHLRHPRLKLTADSRLDYRRAWLLSRSCIAWREIATRATSVTPWPDPTWLLEGRKVIYNIWNTEEFRVV